MTTIFMLNDRQKRYLADLTEAKAKKKVRIFPWSPRSLEVAQLLQQQINAADSSLIVHLVGSVPLKIAGQKDIDLTCANTSENFIEHCKRLQTVIGEPKTINSDSIVWHFNRNGYEVSFYLTDPNKSDQLERQLRMDGIFRDDRELLINYEHLKISLDGLSYKKYIKRKFEFYNKIEFLYLMG